MTVRRGGANEGVDRCFGHQHGGGVILALAHTVQIFQSHVGQNVEVPAAGLLLAETAVRVSRPRPPPAARGQEVVGFLMLQARERHLFDVIGALHAPVPPRGPLAPPAAIARSIYR